MSKIKLIGLSGTNGAGKDTVANLLVLSNDFVFVSVTDLLRTEAKKRGLKPDRKALRTISAEWRRESGLGILVEKAVSEYHASKELGAGLVIASLRNPGEADIVHELGGIVVWIDADPKVRYGRIRANLVSRNRAEEDNKTYKQFLAEELAEMHSVGDKATLDMTAVKKKSDIFIDNTNDSIEQLKKQITDKLGSKNIDGSSNQ